MTNKERLQKIDSDLQAIINKASGSPGGGSGDGDTAELCNVTIRYLIDTWAVPGGVEEYICVAYETIENGNRVVKVLGETDGELDDWGAELRFNDLQVVKGSLLFFSRSSYITGEMSSNLTVISNHPTDSSTAPGFNYYSGTGGAAVIVNGDCEINVDY